MDSTPIRILIVEDNPDDEALLLRQLKKAQLDSHVRIIADGGTALAYLRDESVKSEDLITVFLDLQLPGVSGLQLLEAIRSQERTRHLPVVLMTSSNAPEEINRGRDLGAAFVPKPVTYSTFTKAVADSFHSHNRAAAN